jgi:transaldolase
MIREAEEINSIADNIVVKIPTIPEGVKAIVELTRRDIKTNATLIFSSMQALLVAKVGATYASPFVGRLDNVSNPGMLLVEQTKQIYDNYGFDTQIIVAAVRHPLHVVEAAMVGAHVTTMRFDIMKMLFEHPMTDIGLDQFLADWEKVPK